MGVRVAAVARPTLLKLPPPLPVPPQIALLLLQPTQPTHPPAKLEQVKEEIKQALRQTLQADVKAQLREEFKKSFKEEINNELREEVRQDVADLVPQAKAHRKACIPFHERMLEVEFMKAEQGLRLQYLETKGKRLPLEFDGLASSLTACEETVGARALKTKRQKSRELPRCRA